MLTDDERMVLLRVCEANRVRRLPAPRPARQESSLTCAQPYFPPVRDPLDRTRDPSSAGAAKGASGPRLGLRRLVRNQFDLLLFHLMHAVFSLYMQLRQAWHAINGRVNSILYYHHRSPELIARDLRPLSRRPNHLSVILTLEGDGRQSAAALEQLMNEAAELTAWCASAGIPQLSIYEKTGKSTSTCCITPGGQILVC